MKYRKRNIRVSVRLTEEEHKALLHKCGDAGLSIEGLIRKLIMDVTIRPRPPDSYCELCRQLSAIGNNINQIARVANGTGKAEAAIAQQAVEQMDQVWKAVREEI